MHRYRLTDTLAEVRSADLAFTEEEGATGGAVAGIRLGFGTVESGPPGVGRTRGWAAGLRFAMMLLDGQCEDVDTTVEPAEGHRGNIAEYLMAEVLETQPEDVRTLLLNTSVVDVLQPGLIEELGGSSAGRLLDSLASANVLVEPLVPDQPGCYRYHPLLRDLLRAELAFRAPTQEGPPPPQGGAVVRPGGLSCRRRLALAAEVDAWTKAARLVVARARRRQPSGGRGVRRAHPTC